MSDQEDTTRDEIGALVTWFESDIIYDAHSFAIRFERSLAQKTLRRLGQEALTPIIAHLREHPPTGTNLNLAWGHLLERIERDIDPEGKGPQQLTDTEGWLTWASRFAT